MSRWMKTSFLLIGALAIAGCTKEDERRAAEAQRNVELETTSARVAAEEKVARAKREAAEATTKLERERVEARASLQKQIEAADRKLDSLEKRAEKATGTAKKNIDAAKVETEARKAELRQTMAKLQSETGEAWQSVKSDTERALFALEKSIETFETTMSEKPDR